jgi:hypothetical protein
MVVLTRSMAAARHASLTHALPPDMAVEIAGCVAATSQRPVDDLASLRATCRVMRVACGDRAVGRRVALERQAGAMRWSDHERYLAFVGSLSGAGNPEACFLSGITLVFAHRCDGAGLELLAQAAAAGHKVAAYVLAVLLYGKDNGATAGDVARRHIKEVEGEEAADGSGDVVVSNRRSNTECVRCRGHAVEAVRQVTWNMANLPKAAVVALPLDDSNQCKAKGCGTPNPWCNSAVFCSEDCRMRHECTMFISQLPLAVANFVT